MDWLKVLVGLTYDEAAMLVSKAGGVPRLHTGLPGGCAHCPTRINLKLNKDGIVVRAFEG